MSSGTALVFQFDGAPWGSTISFDSGIPVTLGGNLELDIAGGVYLGSLVHESVQLFDWTGVNPSGQFAQVININDLPTGYWWDTSQLYTTGYVTLVPEPSSFVLLASVPSACSPTLGDGDERRRAATINQQNAFRWVTTRQRFRPRHTNAHRPVFRPFTPPSPAVSYPRPTPRWSGQKVQLVSSCPDIAKPSVATSYGRLFLLARGARV